MVKKALIATGAGAVGTFGVLLGTFIWVYRVELRSVYKQEMLNWKTIQNAK